MKLPFVLTGIAFALILTACAATPLIVPLFVPLFVHNADFSVRQVENPNLPDDWQVDGLAIDIALDTVKKKTQAPSLRIIYKLGAPYAGIVQTAPAKVLRGKRLVLRTHIARRGSTAAVGIWIRAFDKEKRRMAYVNSDETVPPIDESWVPHMVEINVPDSAESLAVGASIYDGDGVMWVDAITAEVR